MKRQPIPQFEFGFADEPMRLVTVDAIDGARVEEERELAAAGRAESEARQTAFVPTKCKRCKTAIKPGTDFCSPQCERVCADIADRAHVAKQEWDEVGREIAKTPGLAAGSYWSSPMAKALATMQRGGAR